MDYPGAEIGPSRWGRERHFT